MDMSPVAITLLSFIGVIGALTGTYLVQLALARPQTRLVRAA